MTYTFNSLFGEVQKHVIVPSPGPDEEDSEEEEDPLSLLSTPRRSSSLNPHDVQVSRDLAYWTMDIRGYIRLLENKGYNLITYNAVYKPHSWHLLKSP